MGVEVLNIPDKQKGKGTSKVPLPNQIHVWDLPVRIFHWGSASCFAAAWFTAGSNGQVHELAGYTMMGLIVMRLWWGFAGTTHARFRDFFPKPGQVFDYLRSMLGGHAKRYIGHNPIGAVMILVLMGLLATICITGWMMLTRRFFGISWVEHLHTYATYGVLGLLPLHIIGALLSSYLHRENLILSMITGRKRADATDQPVSERSLQGASTQDRIRAMESFQAMTMVVIAVFAVWYNIKTPATPGSSQPAPLSDSNRGDAVENRAGEVSPVARLAKTVMDKDDGRTAQQRLAIQLCRHVVAAKPADMVRMFDMIGMFHPIVIRELQIIMSENGLYAGARDGLAGPRTLAAISKLTKTNSGQSVCR